MSKFEELMAFQRDTEALGQISGRMGWDMETMMPEGAAAQRSEEMGAISSVLHARITDPRMGDWLESIQSTELDAVSQAQLRHIRRNYERTSRLPADLAKELAQARSKAHGVWTAAHKDEDVKAFLPTLKHLVALKREEAQAVMTDGQTVYDALLQDYEPGGTEAELTAMFGALRPRLVALRAAVLDAPAPEPLLGEFDEGAQLAMAEILAKTFGYDLHKGRIDKAMHPFSSGSGRDVRITTRTDPKDPFNCFYSTIHEVGHGAYEQQVDDAYLLTPLGRGVSMGVHESQSRIYENQLGRSRAFTGWMHEQMMTLFPNMNLRDPDAFYTAVNRVKKGYIRTEADEVQYNLHVLLRYDLERSMMSGDLMVDDLEAAWNDRFRADFGYDVDKPSNGCLQDVHWSACYFGYFPTYTLGNVYAGCLNQALNAEIPDLDDQLAKGDVSNATAWLRDNVQKYGGLFEPRHTIAQACGFDPTEGPLLDYIEDKFSTIYGL